MADNILTPQYLDMDYSTMKSRLQELLAVNPTFRDYNYEGSNISVLMEMMCYLGMLTTYYVNQIAKNQYMETADIYETVHMLSRLRGYDPRGYISSSTDLTITLTLSGGTNGVSPGDTISLGAWKQIVCTGNESVDENGALLQFSTIIDTIETIPTSALGTYTFSVPIRQGIVYNGTFTGDNIIDNIIYLPSYNFDYDDDLSDQSPSMELSVNNIVWNRASDFYDELSGLKNESNLYLMRYNKYKNYILEFSSARNVPLGTDIINVILLISAGTYGNIGSGLITIPETEFIYNQTKRSYINNTYMSVTNLSAAVGGSNPETLSNIKSASTGAIHSQYRNVTKYDYITHLEAKSDIQVANVWGEQEIAPSGSMLEYNRVYVSTIPVDWGTGTITISGADGSNSIPASGSGLYVPINFTNSFKVDLSTYLEPRKMLCAYEEFVLPEIIFFSFDFGIKIKRTYTFSTVANDVSNKLKYYFETSNRRFNEIISFTNIIEYILDTTNISTTDSFSYVKGIQTLIPRDINVLNGVIINEYGSTEYPVYTSESHSGDNKLRYIQLGHNQFPAVSIFDSTFIQEL